MQATTKQRDTAIDIAKGIAILLVFFGHTVTTPALPVRFIYFFHMPLFFFVSGCFFKRATGFLFFAAKRARSILSPVLFIGLPAALLVGFLSSKNGGAPFNALTVLKRFVIQLPDASDLLWFLPCIFVLSLLFYPISIFLKKSRFTRVLTVATVFALSFVTYYLRSIIGIKFLYWHIFQAFWMLPFFTLGYILHQNPTLLSKITRASSLPLWLLGCLVFGFLNTNFFGGGNIIVHSGHLLFLPLFYLSAFCGVFFVIALSKLIKHCKPLEFFGKFSVVFYSLECVQYFVNFIASKLWFAHSSQFVSFGVSVALISAAFAFMSVFVHFISKHLPFVIGR
jgi:fucose 4-O-acetylase-like acetyltransferase